MEMSEAAEMAAVLELNHRERAQFKSISFANSKDLDFAYTVQDDLVATWNLAGQGPIIGWKVGLTTARMQEMAGIDHPITGAILDQRRRDSGAVLRASDFVRLGIEAEIAVCMGRGIDEKTELNPSEILGRIEMVCAAFEIIEDRNADYSTLDAASLIADNSWNMGVVLGPSTSANEIPTLTGRRGVLTRNDDFLDEGMSQDVGGDPLKIVGWLGAHLARRSQPLQKGQWIMTGSIVTTKFPSPGEKYRFEVNGLEPVEVAIA
jgi:2-keto-4-pentenoate hydratase